MAWRTAAKPLELLPQWTVWDLHQRVEQDSPVVLDVRQPGNGMPATLMALCISPVQTFRSRRFAEAAIDRQSPPVCFSKTVTNRSTTCSVG